MSIKATCTCGAEFKAKPELAGKPVKCPKCGQTFTVPKPQLATNRIQVTCQCGKALQAKPELAGKRVKCPGCGQALAIPDPSVEGDPLGLGGTGNDPLGLGDLGDDPLGLGGDAPTAPLGPTTLPKTTVSAPRTKTARGSGDGLITAAGWVAICFGGYQVVACCVSIVRLILLVVRIGSPEHLVSCVFSTLFSIALIALGIWLGKSGIDIVRRATPRESLERAAQASMIYIGLLMLGLVFGVISLVQMIGSPFGGMFIAIFIRSIILNLIYAIPPAFIVFVNARLK